MMNLFQQLEKEGTSRDLDQDSTSGKKSPIELRIWEALYPDKPFNDMQFRRLCEQLVKWLEEYLAIQAFRKDQDTKDLFLLKKMSTGPLQPFFLTTLHKIKNRLDRQPTRDRHYFRKQFQLEGEHQQYLRWYTHDLPENPYQHLQYSLDQWWILEKLRMGIMNLTLPARQKPEEFPLAPIIESLEETKMAEANPLIKMYLAIHYLYAGKPIDVEEIISLIKYNSQLLSKDNLMTAYQVVLNHLAVRANQTRERFYYQKLHEMYSWAIDRELVFMGEYLPAAYYKNIITLSLLLANTEVPEERTHYLQVGYNYLHHLRHFLPPQDQEDEFYFNLAYYYFAAGDFAKVESSLGGRPFKNLQYAIQGRILGMRARYEMRDFYHLASSIRSLMVYIRKHLPEGNLYRAPFLNMLRFFRRLVESQTADELSKLERAIISSQKVVEKAWLLQKVKERRENNNYSTQMV
ncbi:MAG: hypothetical protein AAFR61_19370 [Bacteroidota bacterium]